VSGVAVTGAGGFVGSHLVDALRGRGEQVRCLVRARTAAERLAALGCEVVSGNLEDAACLARLVEGCATVFHVAGALAASSKVDLLRVNRDGTARLARAAREAGVGRLVYVSSLAVTGPAVRGTAPDETGRPRPVTPYGRSKQAGEEAVAASGVAFTILRPPVVYGPRDRQVLRLFRLARRGVVPVLGDGRQELSLVHAADLADALVAAAGCATAAGRTYHAAHADVHTHEQLARALGRAVERSVTVVRLPAALVRPLLALTGAAARLAGRVTLLAPDKAEEFLAPAWTCSSEALFRDAGWRAQIALDDGLAATARWYAGEGWL
jgi:nucleoside-diphosphate-sugar epimerase